MTRSEFCYLFSTAAVLALVIPNAALADGTVRIINEYWESVEVEVTVGPTDCASNPKHGGRNWDLTKGEFLDVRCDGPQVCWNYRKTDYQGQPWSGWYSEACLGDEIYEHVLN